MNWRPAANTVSPLVATRRKSRVAQHRAALPALALVLAGIEPRGRRRVPDRPAHIEARNPALHLAAGSVTVFVTFTLFFFSTTVVSTSLVLTMSLRGSQPLPVNTMTPWLVPAKTSPPGACCRVKISRPSRPHAALVPGGAAIFGDKDATVSLIVKHARIDRIRVSAIDQQRFYLALRKSVVRRDKAGASIDAQQNPAAVGRQQHMLVVRRIHVDIIDDHVGPGKPLPGRARVGCLVQAFGRSSDRPWPRSPDLA